MADESGDPSGDRSPVPDVAVVLPVRDEEATLAAAVASVLAQEFHGTLEVCIAVAPSTAGTRTVSPRPA